MNKNKTVLNFPPALAYLEPLRDAIQNETLCGLDGATSQYIIDLAAFRLRHSDPTRAVNYIHALTRLARRGELVFEEVHS